MPNVHDPNNAYAPTLPEPPEPFHAPNPNNYTHPLRSPGTIFEQAHTAITHVQNEFQKHIAKVNEDKQHYTTDGYGVQIKRFTNTDTYKSLDHHADRVRQRRDQAQAHYDKARRDLSPDGNTADELRATRYWDRTKGILDTHNAGGVLTKGIELINKATPAELGTLLQELEAYCIARGVSNTDWIDATAAKAAPEYGRAATQLTKAKQAAIITEHNVRRLQSAIQRGHQVPIPISSGDDYDPDK